MNFKRRKAESIKRLKNVEEIRNRVDQLLRDWWEDTENTLEMLALGEPTEAVAIAETEEEFFDLVVQALRELADEIEETYPQCLN